VPVVEFCEGIVFVVSDDASDDVFDPHSVRQDSNPISSRAIRSVLWSPLRDDSVTASVSHRRDSSKAVSFSAMDFI
jgi:hypothetical protein